MISLKTYASALAAASVLIMSSAVCSAGLLAYEGFDLDVPAGTSFWNSGSGFGWGGTNAVWTKFSQEPDRTNQTLNRSELQFQYIDFRGNELKTSGAYAAYWKNSDLWSPWGFSSARRTFEQPIAPKAGEAIWMSLLASRNVPSSQVRAVRFYIIGSPYGGSIYATLDNGAVQWSLFYNDGKDRIVRDDEPITDGEPDFLVLKMLFKESSVEASLWVNPSVIAGGEEWLGTADVKQTWPALPSANGLTGVVIGSFEAQIFYADEIRIGTDAQSVMPYKGKSTFILVK